MFDFLDCLLMVGLTIGIRANYRLVIISLFTSIKHGTLYISAASADLQHLVQISSTFQYKWDVSAFHRSLISLLSKPDNWFI